MKFDFQYCALYWSSIKLCLGSYSGLSRTHFIHSQIKKEDIFNDIHHCYLGTLAPIFVECDAPQLEAATLQPSVSNSKKIRVARKKMWRHQNLLAPTMRPPAHNSVDTLPLTRVQINMFNLSGLVDWEETRLPPRLSSGRCSHKVLYGKLIANTGC